MTPMIIKYPLDLTGRNPDNLVSGEPHTLVENMNGTARAFAPNYGTFYTDTLILRDTNGIELTPYVDYIATYLHEEVTARSGLEVCGVIVVINPNVSSDVSLTYQAVGGDYSLSTNALEQVLETIASNEGPIEWASIIGKPSEYVPGGHLHALWELYGFEYLVTQLERINQSILTGDQAIFDEIRAYAYSLYEDGKAYTDALDARFQDHMADSTNPHNVTKAQVGLGNVLNYTVSSVAEAEVGTLNTRYMTPLRTTQAITYQVGNKLDNHMANVNNPHSVTKAQVGLGNVLNYGIASQLIAEGGTSNTHYMTALRTAQAIKSQVGNDLSAHVANVNNPHNVTKAQVGLGSVVNLPLSNQGDAEAGTVNNVYMTPLRTRQAITRQVGTALGDHVNNTNNPHSVTKAQVGLGNVNNWGIASLAAARDGTVNNVYMTPLRTSQAIATQAGSLLDAHVGDRSNPHNVTKAQVGLGNVQNYTSATRAEAEAGSRNDLYMTPLRSFQLIRADVPRSAAATGNTFVLRNGAGTASFSPPTALEHPTRISDEIGKVELWSYAPGSRYIRADGRAVSRATYAQLFSRIGTSHGNGNGSTTFNVPDARELEKYIAISSGGGGAFGNWRNDIPASATANTDGIIHVISDFNREIDIHINGIRVSFVSRRDKYGTGNVTATAAIRQGDSYSIGGSHSSRRLLEINLSPPAASKLSANLNYYICAR